jgi:hypothetical protein
MKFDLAMQDDNNYCKVIMYAKDSLIVETYPDGEVFEIIIHRSPDDATKLKDANGNDYFPTVYFTINTRNKELVHIVEKGE